VESGWLPQKAFGENITVFRTGKHKLNGLLFQVVASNYQQQKFDLTKKAQNKSFKLCTKLGEYETA
jgi:hypothetical protein